MEKETTEILIIASGLFCVTTLGVIMLYVTRSARIKNQELRAKGIDSQFQAFQSEMKRGNIIEAIKAYFSGTISRPEAFAGRILAVAVIAAVSVFLFIGCFLLIYAI
jgi:hypothetical protein